MSVKEVQNPQFGEKFFLEARLFGAPRFLRGDGEAVHLPGRKDRALLSYLCVHAGVPQARERLVELIWPDAAEGAGRASLRQSLATIRKSLGDAAGTLIKSDRDTVTLGSTGLVSDVALLEASAAAGDATNALPAGGFLEGLAGMSAEFEIWRATETARLRSKALGILSQQAEVAEAGRQLGEAAELLSRALEIDPIAEAVHRKLMLVFAAQGRADAALRQFQTLEGILVRELGVQPEKATVELYREIRSGRHKSSHETVSKQPSETPGRSFEKTIGLDFRIPDYPSIAVLPFAVMSADPEQEFFADGLAEDITTALAKISRLMVVARNSTFTYKGRAVDVKVVSREQGVRYVLEGSVRTSDGRVRVSAQLVDATTGLNIWAERYDRELAGIFAVQDEIVREIVVALDVQLREGEQHRVWSKGTESLEAWECLRLATDACLGGSAAEQPRAKELIERALDLDPGYAVAWAMRGWLYFTEADVGGGLGDPLQFERAQAAAFQCGQRALEIDPDCADAYGMLALTYLNAAQHDKAIEMSEKAIALAPNSAELLGGVASAVMRKSGRPDRGLEVVKKAMRLCPFYRPGLLRALGSNYMALEQLEKAVACYRESLKRETGYLAAYVNLTSSLGQMGALDEAREAAKDVLRQEPEFSISAYARGLSYKNPNDTKRIVAGLRASGLPE